MKSLLLNPLVVGALMAIVAVGLVACGVSVNRTDAVVAGLMASVCSLLAVTPIVLARPKDQAFAFQMALAGTVLQMLAGMVISATLMVGHVVRHGGTLGYWLVGGFWIALVVTIVQLRRLVIPAPVAGAEK